MTKISVIMPVYNGEKYIEETIKSVLNQTYADFEYIIIDDGSVDDTLNIINTFSDNRIIVIKANHGGIVKALNLGLEKSSGEYIVRIDADDICVQNRFEILINYMEKHKDVVVCGSWATKIDEKGIVTGNMIYPPIDDKNIVKYAFLHNPFIHPSVIFRKSVLVQVGKYRSFKHNEDYELWTRMLKKGKGHNIPEELIRYRIHSNQITKKANLSMRIVGIRVRILALFRLFLQKYL